MAMSAFHESFPNGIQTFDNAVHYLTHFHGYIFDLEGYPEKVTFSAQYVTYTVPVERVMVLARQYYEDGQRQAEEVQTSLHDEVTSPMTPGQSRQRYLLIAALLVLVVLGVVLFRLFTA